MVVRKAGGPNISKKKNIEEAKKMAEKKKLMMKEEESEDEDMSEEESDDDDDMSEIEEGSDESDESEEEEEESDEDEDDSLDDDEDTKKPNKSRDLGQSFADKSLNSKTPVKSSNKAPAKTPNKLTVQQNSQKKQSENKISKTPKQQNISQSKVEFSPSPKKNDDNLKTPASLKQSKAAGSAKRKAVEMEEDDDDDEDDDDEEEDDDEDDDDEEEEEEDDEEEEEDEDDEKEAPQLVKSIEPPAKKAKNDVPSIDLKASEEQRRKERDIRSLFIRGFPEDTTEEEIKSLSSDIVAVRMPANKKRKRPGMQGSYAFVEFKSEKAAEENFSVFEKKKIRGKELFVDFVGAKSKNKAFVDRTKEREQRNINKQKLFVSNIPSEATMEDLGKAFPAAVNVYLNSGANRTAQISFDSEDAAAEAFKKNSSLKIKGTPVVVLYALINKNRKGRGGGRGQASLRRPFHRGQGFRKSFNEQRKPVKHSFDDEDDDE